MIFFTEIRPTKHYAEEHEHEMPWHDVVDIILRTKNPRKKGATYEIDTGKHYIVFTIERSVLRVINAKRR